MNRFPCVLAAALFAGCGNDAEPTAATPQLQAVAPAYELIEIDAHFGAGVTVGAGINNRSEIAGYSRLADGTRHAALWRDTLYDLGTLGGPNSTVPWPGINNTGMIVGISQTDILDESGEDWSCAAFMAASPYTCVGFVWQDGVMTALETLGGPNGFATMVNGRGQVVGWAENTVRDPTCLAPQVHQFRAVLWEPDRGTMRELPPLPGDSTSAATAINERGQVAGISGSCYVAVGDSSARAAVLWQGGVAREIPTLGGHTWNTPMDINDAGHVAGFANRGDDAAGNPRLFAFLWTGGATSIDLGALDGDDLSQAYGINERGQVVGRSCGATGCRAFLYQHGIMHDLNELVPAGSDQLQLARHINDAGVISVQGVDDETGQTRIYVAVPRGAELRQ